MEDLEASLLCHETETSLDIPEDGGDGKEFVGWGSVPALILEEDEDDYIEILIKKEALHEMKDSEWRSSHLVEGNAWRQRVRSESIQWIHNARSFLGFHYRTAYLAVTYLDRFLAKRSIGDGKLWTVRLLSVACLSLAAKMEECDVPTLSGFPSQEYNFEGRVIRRMELLILHTLDWRMNSVTPFVFLNFFVLRITKRPRLSELYPDAVELIIAASEEINLVDYRPSAIAAAAVLASSLSAQLTRKAVELKTGVIPSWESQHYEHVVSCYDLMQEIKRKVENKTPSGSLVPCYVGVFKDAPSLSLTGLKRRIHFITDTNIDQNLPVKKAKQ